MVSAKYGYGTTIRLHPIQIQIANQMRFYCGINNDDDDQ